MTTACISVPYNKTIKRSKEEKIIIIIIQIKQ